MLPEFGFEDPRVLSLYVGGFLLVHLLVFAYLAARTGSAGGAPLADAEGSSAGGPRVPDVVPPEQLPPVDSDSPVECPHCGADNEPTFRFCRNCVADIGGRRSAVGTGAGQGQRRPF